MEKKKKICLNCNNWSTPYWHNTKDGENGQCCAVLSDNNSSAYLDCMDGYASLVTLPVFSCLLFARKGEE